jgi:hypothetical protein
VRQGSRRGNCRATEVGLDHVHAEQCDAVRQVEVLAGGTACLAGAVRPPPRPSRRRWSPAETVGTTRDSLSRHNPYVRLTDPHRQGQDRHPAAHPGPVPGLRALVQQHPAAPRAGRRTRSPVPDENGQGRRLGHDHPRQPGTRPHQTRPGPERTHNRQNAGRSARLTREPRTASDT